MIYLKCDFVKSSILRIFLYFFTVIGKATNEWTVDKVFNDKYLLGSHTENKTLHITKRAVILIPTLILTKTRFKKIEIPESVMLKVYILHPLIHFELPPYAIKDYLCQIL